ncbi:MAG: PP2C family protein-serine/threonine phosphatase [Gemmataceae bacterium]
MPVAADFFQTTTRNWRARLAISVDLMRELSRYTDPDETYQVYARRMAQLYPTARQLTLSRRGLERPNYRVTRFNLWPDRINPYKEPHRLPDHRGGLFADLVYADEPRVIDELDVHPDDPAAEYLAGQQSLLAIPLFEHGATTNMVVLTREEPAAFPREQVPELVWMSNLFGRAVQTQVLSDRLQELYQAAEYELRTVADLQHSLLPAAVPAVPGLDLAVHYRTANRAGGDYYDFFPLSGGRLGVLVADVSGHGTPAAVLMAITHSLAHAFVEPPDDPGRFLAHLNAHLARRYTITTGHFVTAIYAIFDPAAGSLTYATAGHPAPRLSAGSGWEAGPTAQMLPLGVSSRDLDYAAQTVPFPPGSTAVLFTDGITDAANAAGEPFGSDRLDAALSGCDGNPSVVVGRVLGSLDRFAGGTPVADDRTLLVVRRT